MAQFDYKRAWAEVAMPALQDLPLSVKETLAEVARLTPGLHQNTDLSMPWPDNAAGAALHDAMHSIANEDLALASRVIYFAGHWWPGRQDPILEAMLPGRDQGSHWKFSHYADQILRARFDVPKDPEHEATGLLLIEGALRVFYSSRDSWSWVEVAPATEHGMRAAQKALAFLNAALDGTRGSKRESAAYDAIDVIKGGKVGWPEGAWKRLATVTEDYVETTTI